VTSAAVKTLGDMNSVKEMNMVRKSIYLFPFDRLAFAVMRLKNIYNRGVIYDYFTMAKHTSLQRRYARAFAFYRCVMAKYAADLFNAAMQFVTKWYGLLRADSTGIHSIKDRCAR
jgi:uncharacterized protein YydD (DUF2326 family)